MKTPCYCYNQQFYSMTISLVSSAREQEINEITPKCATHGKTWQNSEECCAAARAIDKDLSTEAAIQITNKKAGWLILYFGESYFIHKIVIYWTFYTNWYYTKYQL